MESPKISVVIITYNQEAYIARTLDSVLSQREYVYEICICDDCSSDNTWQIVNNYAERNPGLFKVVRNEKNVGIFENIEKSWGTINGDMVYRVAGDDACGEGWLKTVTEYILANNIDYKNELVCIYGDYVGIDPNGVKTVHHNDLAASGKNMISLSLRGLVGNRSACYSAAIVKKFFKVSQGRSHIAETAIDRQLQLFTQKNYYIPAIGNVYYTGIGVSTKIMNDLVFNERKQMNSYLIQVYADKGYEPSKADLGYMAYEDAFADFLKHKLFVNSVKLFKYWILSYDSSIGIRSLNIPFWWSHFLRLIHLK